MKNKLFNTITAMLLLAQAVTASPEGNWSSFRNSSWDYSSDNVTVTTAADLAQLAYLVANGTNFSGKTVTLGADIDLGNHYWRAIGSNSNSFNGTFDGAGHTISHLDIELTYDRQGLFAYLDGGTVKNVMLASGSICGGAGTGAIVGYNSSGTIENCHVLSAVTVTITNSSASWSGGIAGYSSGTIAGCTCAAAVSSSGSVVGGIAGRNVGTVKHSLYLGTNVSGGSEVGAITGNNTGTLTCNFYTEASLKGVNGADVTTGNGAVRGYSYSNKPTEIGSLLSTYGMGNYTGIAVYDEGLLYDGLYYITTDITWWGIRSGADGTHSSPYILSTVSDLNLLSTRVAAGNNFADTYFKMGADIDYSSETVTDGANYVPVGSSAHTFNGYFNGDGHTISGISINKTDNTGYQGVFGCVDGEGWVMNLVLANSTIQAYQYSAGIVGYFKGTLIDNCHVLGNVSILSNGDDGYHFGFGGIVGRVHSGGVTDCSSAATVSGGTVVGGIAGDVLSGGSLADCLALGATLTGSGVGAICGQTSSNTELIVLNNYSACTVNRMATSNAMMDNADNTTFLEQVAERNTFLGTQAAHKVQLTGRTLLKDGNWNTLCLPFAMTAAQIADSPLADAIIKELNTSETALTAATGALTLKFSDVTTIEAGKPYIVKWATTGENISNPEFSGVTISSTAAQEVVSGDGNVKFVGQYSPFSITADNINEILYVASGNKIGYSASARTLRSFRAHFWVKPNGEAQAAHFIDIDWGDGTTEVRSIDNGQLIIDNEAGAWYSLDGRRLSGMPTLKGVYIVNGKKKIVK